MSNRSMEWKLGHGRTLLLDRPRLMAILNVTPDSFSDGGRFVEVDRALAHAMACVEDGADMIDVGGESTRPGAERVPVDEQLRRVIPVIERLEAETGALISVDTTRAEVARQALAAGAHAVNDVAAGLEDQGLLRTVAESNAGVILMHRLRPPNEDSYSDRYETPPKYGDVVGEVRDFLKQRASAAVNMGVHERRIVIDPGLGFGKTVEQNFELVRRGGELRSLGFPTLGASSRKSFIGQMSGVEAPRDRVAGTLAVSVAQYLAGVRIFRVHDVRAHREALGVARAILS
ncbi:MAG: dihydropteroate synthase [Phycisphaerales bacterium]